MGMPSNVTCRVEGKKLVIEVDASETARKSARSSASGKTRLLATSAGVMSVAGLPGVTVALNVMIPVSP